MSSWSYRTVSFNLAGKINALLSRPAEAVNENSVQSPKRGSSIRAHCQKLFTPNNKPQTTYDSAGLKLNVSVQDRCFQILGSQIKLSDKSDTPSLLPPPTTGPEICRQSSVSTAQSPSDGQFAHDELLSAVQNRYQEPDLSSRDGITGHDEASSDSTLEIEDLCTQFAKGLDLQVDSNSTCSTPIALNLSTPNEQLLGYDVLDAVPADSIETQQRRHSFPCVVTCRSLDFQVKTELYKNAQLERNLVVADDTIRQLHEKIIALEMMMKSQKSRTSALEFQKRHLQAQRKAADQAATKWYDRYVAVQQKLFHARGVNEQVMDKLVQEKQRNSHLDHELCCMSDGYRVAKEGLIEWKNLCAEEEKAKQQLIRDFRRLKRHRRVDRAIIAALKVYRSRFAKGMPGRLQELVDELYFVGDDIAAQAKEETELRAEIARHSGIDALIEVGDADLETISEEL